MMINNISWKPAIILLLIASFSMIAASCSSSTSINTSTLTQAGGPVLDAEVVIGVMLPQTGLSAALGEQMMNGIKLAINESTAKMNVRLVVEDDQCDAKAGVAAAQKLVSVDNVDAILGPICTVAILSSSSLIEEAKIPRITTGMVLQKTANAGDYHFSFLPEMRHQMNAIATYAKAHGLTTVGSLALNDDLGRESVSELKKSLDAEGVAVVAEEYFDRSETDFKTALAKVNAHNSDAVYILGYVSNMIQMVKQANELGMKKPILSWNLFQDHQVLSLGLLAEQVIFTYPEDPRYLSVKSSFHQHYIEQFGKEPTLYAANAYDSYRILSDAISLCKKDRECIKRYLYAIKNYEGANGFLTVDNKGVGQRSQVSLKTVRNRLFVPAE